MFDIYSELILCVYVCVCVCACVCVCVCEKDRQLRDFCDWKGYWTYVRAYVRSTYQVRIDYKIIIVCMLPSPSHLFG